MFGGETLSKTQQLKRASMMLERQASSGTLPRVPSLTQFNKPPRARVSTVDVISMGA